MSTAEPVGDFDVGVDRYFGEEESFEIRSGGQQRTLCRKKFKMDLSSTVRLFVDLELLDQLPTLYAFYVLALHANVTLKRVVRSMTIVVNEYGKKMVVLCILRSKCPKPRYDIVLLDPAEADLSSAVTRMIWSSNFFKWYRYIPEEVFNHDFAVRMLKEYLEKKEDDKGRTLVWDPSTGPNKDETGRLMSEGYSPNLPITVEQDATTLVASKRVAARGATFGDAYASTRVRPAKRARRSCAAGTRKRAKSKQVISELHIYGELLRT